MTKDLENKLLLLKRSVENLSKPYKEQLKIYPNYVDIFDEIISDFYDAFQLLPIFMENKMVSYLAVYELLRCHNLIELNLSIEERNTDESFEKDTVWNLVREYANNAVIQLSGNVSD